MDGMPFTYWSFNPQSEGIKRWGLGELARFRWAHESRAFLPGLAAYIRDRSAHSLPLSLSPPCENTVRSDHLQAKRAPTRNQRAPTRNQMEQHLDIGVPSLQSYENSIWCVSCPVDGILYRSTNGLIQQQCWEKEGFKDHLMPCPYFTEQVAKSQSIQYPPGLTELHRSRARIEAQFSVVHSFSIYGSLTMLR